MLWYISTKVYLNISGELPIGIMPLNVTETSIKLNRLPALSSIRLKKRSLFSVSLSCKTVLPFICKIVYFFYIVKRDTALYFANSITYFSV